MARPTFRLLAKSKDKGKDGKFEYVEVLAGWPNNFDDGGCNCKPSEDITIRQGKRTLTFGKDGEFWLNWVPNRQRNDGADDDGELFDE